MDKMRQGAAWGVYTLHSAPYNLHSIVSSICSYLKVDQI